MSDCKRIAGSFLAALCTGAIGGCTAVGRHDFAAFETLDFGPREELRICILADEGVGNETAKQLLASVSEEFAVFGLDVTVPWIRPWVRPAFLSEGIVEDVLMKPLEAPCDRLLALVGRNIGDLLWGLSGMEILGAVDTPTHTRGYVVAKTASLNQIFVSPSDTAIHESYHFLGCGHGVSLADCYANIRNLKQAARNNRERGNDFFPGFSWKGHPVESRQEVDAIAHGAVRYVQLKKQAEQTTFF